MRERLDYCGVAVSTIDIRRQLTFEQAGDEGAMGLKAMFSKARSQSHVAELP
jgi:hypothetical protein